MLGSSTVTSPVPLMEVLDDRRLTEELNRAQKYFKMFVSVDLSINLWKMEKKGKD